MSHSQRAPTINRYLDQIAPTPLVPVQVRVGGAQIWCKLEMLHPSGSTKDRIARYILGKALRRGEVHPGDVVVEASSGSTSIAMALACCQLGLRFVAVMPEGVSNERGVIIRSYGAEVVSSPREQGILGAIELAEAIAAQRGGFLPHQFSNPDNAEAHRHETAREILAQIPGASIDAVVSGVGTGGTLVGLYRGFVDLGCGVTPFAARPVTHAHPGGGAGQPLLDIECCSFSSAIPGVVDGLSEIYRNADLPGLVELEIEDHEALETTRALHRRGFPVGPSSGLNFRAAELAAEQLEDDAVIVTVFPDRMERYFSTALFDRA